ncbi:hypothetical protein BLOT_003442 [Blomia tropicalis]|nr:hypothetical protein BLOT_003442 [Blomia tropicalis]
MSLTNCAAIGCKNNYRNTIGQLPKVNGSTWMPSKHSKLCSSHFYLGSKSNDKNHPSYNPSIHPRLSMGGSRKRAQESLATARHTKHKIFKVESESSTSTSTDNYDCDDDDDQSNDFQSSEEDVIFSDIVEKSCQTEMVSYDDDDNGDLTEFTIEHDMQNVKTQVNHHNANQKIKVSVGPSSSSTAADAQIPCFYGFETLFEKLKHNINLNDYNHRNYLEKLTSVRWPVFEMFLVTLNEEQYKPRKFPNSLLQHSDKIIHICSVIVNLQNHIFSSITSSAEAFELDSEINDCSVPDIINLEENDYNFCVKVLLISILVLIGNISINQNIVLFPNRLMCGQLKFELTN